MIEPLFKQKFDVIIRKFSYIRILNISLKDKYLRYEQIFTISLQQYI